MAADRTQIANMALSHIRDKGLLQNVDSDTSSQAKQCRLWFDQSRQETLEDYDFGFARSRWDLTEHGDDPPAEWGYRYQAPSALLFPRYIMNPLGRGNEPLPFDWERDDDGNMSILADIDDAYLVGTRNETNVLLFTPKARTAWSYLLAYYICGPLGKASMQTRLLQSYNLFAGVAGANLGNVTHKGTEGQPEASWIQER